MNAIFNPASARERILLAAFKLVRMKGFAATSVDELCREAGVTKGAFFHHFASKEQLGAAAARHWSEVTGAMFAVAPYHALPDPLDRVLGYVDLRLAMLAGDPAEFTCYAGTTVQETFGSSAAIREACRDSIFDHAGKLEHDIALAMAQHGVVGTSASSLALFTQASLQGAFILAKADGGPAVAIEMIGHLRRYIDLLFQTPNRKANADVHNPAIGQ